MSKRACSAILTQLAPYSPYRCARGLLVTGGAGFIGSAFIRYLLNNPEFSGKIVNLDLLTYASNLENLSPVKSNPRYFFEKGNINDQKLLQLLVEKYAIDTIVNFAAETHVDRSIDSPYPFIEANILGTFAILEVIRKNPSIHLHHISTDEVYGSLGKEGFFSETSPYKPSSPYSASKAAADHLVLSYAHTYGLSVTLSHCTNNYGPCQYSEKFIPLSIVNALAGKAIPLYGTGENKRDWLFVDDHVEGIYKILTTAKSGSVYDLGGNCEMTNLELLKLVLKTLAAKTGQNVEKLLSLITFVKDRPGHDYRYAIDFSKIKNDLNWSPRHSLEEGLSKTIDWYINKKL